MNIDNQLNGCLMDNLHEAITISDEEFDQDTTPDRVLVSTNPYEEIQSSTYHRSMSMQVNANAIENTPSTSFQSQDYWTDKHKIYHPIPPLSDRYSVNEYLTSSVIVSNPQSSHQGAVFQSKVEPPTTIPDPMERPVIEQTPIEQPTIIQQSADMPPIDPEPMIEELQLLIYRFNCSVCYELLPLSSLILGCGHIFCKSCIDRLQRKKCPLCRKPFKKPIKMRL